MNYLQSLGYLSLASRLRNLSDRLMQGASKIYRELDYDFEPRWFPVTHYLYNQGSVSVMALARDLQQTHPAILQVINIMQKKGLVKHEKDAEDRRKTIISLTPEGMKMAENLKKTWEEISIATSDLLMENQADLLNDLSRFESGLDKMDIYLRVKKLKMN
jgi:DNA-binding MarR family transcriptional regulator